MIIIQDTREQRPLSFTPYKAQVKLSKLPAGDYSLEGFETRIAIERKSLDDLINCLCHERERFERELTLLRDYEYAAVVIESHLDKVRLHHYRSDMTPHSALMTIISFSMRYRVPFLWCSECRGAAYWTYNTLRLFWEASPQTPAGFKK